MSSQWPYHTRNSNQGFCYSSQITSGVTRIFIRGQTPGGGALSTLKCTHMSGGKGPPFRASGVEFRPPPLQAGIG